MDKRYISDEIDINKFEHGQFNIIASGTGTGKTEFVRRTLLNEFPDVSPGQILYVTSRSMIRDQQGLLDGINKLDGESDSVIQYWNGDDELKEFSDSGIWIMNYNQLIHILDWWTPHEGKQLENIKIAIFDECHALFADNYIEDMSLVRLWIRERTRDERVLLIGMTATPGIMMQEYGRQIQKPTVVNDEYLVNYKAKNLIVTTLNNLLMLYVQRFQDEKVIILCQTVRDCNALHKYIRNSAVLVSTKNEAYTPEMELLRRFILEHNKLPDTTAELGDEGDDVHPIDVLITTSSMREGININKDSGINTVICCQSDEIHVKQFVGRCRYSIVNLVVVHNYVSTVGRAKDQYIFNARTAFANYIKDKTDREWFDSISDIVECKFEEIERFMIDAKEDGFVEWFDRTCVVKEGMTPAEIEAREITKYGMIDIAEKAWECRLFGQNPEVYTFNATVSYIRDRLGYRVETHRKTVDGDRYTYKVFYKEN